MRSEQELANIALVERVFAEVLGPLDSQALEGLFAPGFIAHDPALATGIPALMDHLDRAKAAHPRAHRAIKRIMADGDLVMVHSHVVPEPGEAGLAAADIFRVARDRIAEHWTVVQPVETKPKNANGMF